MPSPSLARSSSAPPHAEGRSINRGQRGTGTLPHRDYLSEDRHWGMSSKEEGPVQGERDHREPRSHDAGMDTEGRTRSDAKTLCWCRLQRTQSTELDWIERKLLTWLLCKLTRLPPNPPWSPRRRCQTASVSDVREERLLTGSFMKCGPEWKWPLYQFKSMIHSCATWRCYLNIPKHLTCCWSQTCCCQVSWQVGNKVKLRRKKTPDNRVKINIDWWGWTVTFYFTCLTTSFTSGGPYSTGAPPVDWFFCIIKII